MTIEWRGVPDFECIYAVSNTGQIMRLKSGPRTYPGKILTPTMRPDRRLCITLRAYPVLKKKAVYVHRLVAAAFLGACPPDKEVNHIDGNPANNRLENLEYLTRSKNMLHAYKLGLQHREYGVRHYNARLTEGQVREIHSSKEPASVLVQQFGVAKSTISGIRHGKSWKYLALPECSLRSSAGQRNGMAKFTDEEVRMIRASPLPPTVLATMFGTSYKHIWQIRTGKRWKHII